MPFLPLSLEDAERRAAELDEAAASSPSVDPFCSATSWALSAREAFHPTSEPWLYESEVPGAGFFLGARDTHPSLGRFVAPLESMWGLASPLLGPDPEALCDELGTLAWARRSHWDTLWLSGLSRDGAAFRRLVRTFQGWTKLGLGPETVRWEASLRGGWDGFLSRRSAGFRKKLRQALRRARRAGLTCEVLRPTDPDEARAAYARALAVEARSWKGREGTGIVESPMREFYAAMLPRLARAGTLWVLFARHEGRDRGFLLGGTVGPGAGRGASFRGLQMSFDDDYRPLALGNVLQARAIQALAQAGVETYDLGTDMDYKRRWAEPGLTTVALAVILRRP